MNTIKQIIASAWDSFLGRAAVIGISLGFVPFVLLTQAHAALSGN